MNTKTLIAALALTGGVLLAGCGHNHSGSTPTPVVVQPPQPLSTAQVLAIAQQTSETDDPKPVAGGALTLADANDETADPIPVG